MTNNILVNLKPRKVRADFHNHLRTSSRLSEEDFNMAVDIASERLGPGGTFGMINFADKRYEKFVGLGGYERRYVGENKNAVYVPEKDILVIKGQEVPTRQGHLLVLGLRYDEHVEQHRSLEDTIEQAKEFGATIIADHPFFTEGVGNYLRNRHSFLEKIDAIEIYNGEAAINPLANWKANELFNSVVTYSTGAISTSDGHSLNELGTSWTEIDEIDRKDKSNFLASLKKSVQNTKEAERKNGSSVIGALNHAVDLVFITKIAPKIGLRIIFETERPESYIPPRGLR